MENNYNSYGDNQGQQKTIEQEKVLIGKLKDKVLESGNNNYSGNDIRSVISEKEVSMLINVSDYALQELSDAANEITRKLNGNKVDIESLINAKKGLCAEDCTFCSQSAFYKSGIDTYSLLPDDTIVENAKKAKEAGSESFCLVCAWRGPSQQDFEKICNIIKKIKSQVGGIDINCSLGFIDKSMANTLKDLGVKKYNHNLEAANSFFDKICSTHTYKDRIETAKIVKSAKLELCCGGILGLGETRQQRLELGLALADLQPEEVPINILVPQKGTPLESQQEIPLSEILRAIAVFRFLMPRTILKIAGGREVRLSNDQEKVLLGGANGIITGGYLTIGGNSANQDIQMISKMGLEYQ